MTTPATAVHPVDRVLPPGQMLAAVVLDALFNGGGAGDDGHGERTNAAGDAEAW